MTEDAGIHCVSPSFASKDFYTEDESTITTESTNKRDVK
jgi:hypothetical protein